MELGEYALQDALLLAEKGYISWKEFHENFCDGQMEFRGKDHHHTHVWDEFPDNQSMKDRGWLAYDQPVGEVSLYECNRCLYREREVYVDCPVCGMVVDTVEEVEE